jgi:shikimate dehydrogenase
VLGSPIAHSLSPVLHAAAYRELGLSGWSYQAIECTETSLASLLASLGPDWAGLSLTMPLKRAVLPLLDRVQQLALDVGGANTVIFEAGGRYGCNTDVPGMVTAITEAGLPSLGQPLILGAGATAAAALAALRSLGAGRVTVAVRSRARAASLLAAAARLVVDVRLVPFGELAERPGWDLLVSTVPAGAADGYAGLLAAGQLRAGAVLDAVYDPWPTRLALAAEQSSSVVISGFELLVQQAARQVELMTGRAAPVGAMREAGLAELGRRTGD